LFDSFADYVELILQKMHTQEAVYNKLETQTVPALETLGEREKM